MTNEFFIEVLRIAPCLAAIIVILFAVYKFMGILKKK